MNYDVLNNKELYYSRLKESKKAIVKETNYSLMFDIDGKRTLLNEEGNGDLIVFSLSNKCKNDCERYVKSSLSGGSKKPISNKSEIFWFFENDSNLMPVGVDYDIYKVDLSQAYWQKAVEMGVVSEATNNAFNNLVFDDYKTAKMCRLKALGSLATMKTVKLFKNGVCMDEFVECNKTTRAVYLAVCEAVACDMFNIMKRVNGFYYYWDCVFIKADDSELKRTIREIERLGYDCKFERSQASVVDYNYKKVLQTIDNEDYTIEYPLKR